MILSILCSETGNRKPSVLNKTAITKSLNAYRTATGFFMSGEVRITFPLLIKAFIIFQKD
jgi:hypothetical protein